MTNLDAIAEEVKKCSLCPLAYERKNAVAGEGSASARLVLIGEAPGVEEDKQGRPFVGRAGKLLDQALKEAGLNRSKLFITNVVKCRPPKNRRPTKGEMKVCTSRYLVRQLELLRPQIVCLLGSTAAESLLGRSNIASMRGKSIQTRYLTYFVTYHPAAVLYNPRIKHQFFSDIKSLSKILKTKRSGG